MTKRSSSQPGAKSSTAKDTFSLSLSLAALTSPPVDVTNRKSVLKMLKKFRYLMDGGHYLPHIFNIETFKIVHLSSVYSF